MDPSGDAVRIVEALLGQNETDLFRSFALAAAVLGGECVGPVHHGLVAGVVVQCHRVRHGMPDEDCLRRVVGRAMGLGSQWQSLAGSSGSALAVGVAFAELRGRPSDGPGGTAAVMGVALPIFRQQCRVGKQRCCLRESWLALASAAHLSLRLLGRQLEAVGPLPQGALDVPAFCRGTACPLKALRESDVA